MYAYLVDRCTTDKLQEALNSFGCKGWRPTAHFQGGRDWVVVAEREAADAAELADLTPVSRRGPRRLGSLGGVR